jgi:hypothetical protein
MWTTVYIVYAATANRGLYQTSGRIFNTSFPPPCIASACTLASAHRLHNRHVEAK